MIAHSVSKLLDICNYYPYHNMSSSYKTIIIFRHHYGYLAIHVGIYKLHTGFSSIKYI
jgi:hypothetical protein